MKVDPISAADRRRKFLILIVGLCSWAGLNGCSTLNEHTALQDASIVDDAQNQLPAFNEQLFGESIDIETPAQVLGLSRVQKNEFLSYYRDKQHGETGGHDRLAQYLKDIGLKFKYSSKTANANETLESNSGNCMSLAVLTSALAQVVGIETSYQLVNRAPIYQEFGGLVFKTQHIRSIIYEPRVIAEIATRKHGSDSIQSFSRGYGKAIVDYYPSRYVYASKFISEKEFLGLYYRNRAAEALSDQRNNESYWLLKQSLLLEPDNADALNSLAILFRRFGEDETAEEVFKYGIKKADHKIILLKNYRVLLASQNRSHEVGKINKELEHVQEDNPFNWLFAANELYQAADYLNAMELYEKTILLAPYLHQGYFGIAKTHYALGNYDSAEKALIQAKAEALDFDSRQLYQAKLSALHRDKL